LSTLICRGIPLGRMYSCRAHTYFCVLTWQVWYWSWYDNVIWFTIISVKLWLWHHIFPLCPTCQNITYVFCSVC